MKTSYAKGRSWNDPAWTLSCVSIPHARCFVSLAEGIFSSGNGHEHLRLLRYHACGMAARLTDHIWTVREWLLCPL
jgi:hypothetical protein